MPKSSRDGMGTITSRPAACPRPTPELAWLQPPRIASRAHGGLTALTWGLARGPFTTGAAGYLALLLGHVQTMVRREPPTGVVPDIRRPRVERDLQTRSSVRHTT